VLDRLSLSMSLSGPNRICSVLARQKVICFFLPQFTIYCGRGEGFTVPTALQCLFTEEKVYNTNSLQCIGDEERIASIQYYLVWLFEPASTALNCLDCWAF
jgi:hypothetical protein